MTREWKPGDVALVYGHVALVWNEGDMLDGRLSFVYTDSDGDSCSSWLGVKDARPLVVIDPEDLRELARLESLIDSWRDRVPYSDMAEDGDLTPVTSLQAALREYADPKPPKPEEPTGLGAVVEDAAGQRWIRHQDDPGRAGSRRWAWYPAGYVGDRVRRPYSDIDAVRVLSEGVQP